MIIGIDISTTRTGLTKLTLTNHVRSEDFVPKKNIDIIKKQIAVVKYVLHNITDEDFVVLENYSHAGRGKADTVLKEIGGIVRFGILKRTKMYPILVAPKTLKKWITGSGGSEKSQTLHRACVKFKQEFANDDIAESYGLADLGRELIFSFIGGGRSLKKYEKECLSTVKKSLLPRQRERLSRGVF